MASSNPEISFNLFVNNSAGWGSGIFCGFSNPSIINNTFNGNIAEVRGGGIFCTNANPEISFNLIVNNSAVWGSGICCSHSNPSIINNTISRNIAEMQGGGIFCTNSNPVIVNTIFWADSASQGDELYIYVHSSPIVTYCDIEGGWEGEGNIDADPFFCDPDSLNFWLADNSPCVGTGRDGDDIGVYGVGCEATDIFDNDAALPSEYALEQNYPNPFNSSTIIKYDLPQQSYVTIEIYDILGRKVETLLSKYQQAGYHQATWQAGGFSSGIYFYKIQAGYFTGTGMMVLIK
jgi:predicted outer membrane repeat protein